MGFSPRNIHSSQMWLKRARAFQAVPVTLGKRGSSHAPHLHLRDGCSSGRCHKRELIQDAQCRARHEPGPGTPSASPGPEKLMKTTGHRGLPTPQAPPVLCHPPHHGKEVALGRTASPPPAIGRPPRHPSGYPAPHGPHLCQHGMVAASLCPSVSPARVATFFMALWSPPPFQHRVSPSGSLSIIPPGPQTLSGPYHPLSPALRGTRSSLGGSRSANA